MMKKHFLEIVLIYLYEYDTNIMLMRITSIKYLHHHIDLEATFKEMGYSNLYGTHDAENAHNESYGCHLQKSKIKTEFHQLV